jgi:glycosyltransferase involved in cell wall biosynthesis
MQTKTPKVSVIIPTFQEGGYLAEVLSRVAETRSPTETIVVDSGSQDNTVKIAKQFTDKVYPISKRGISKAKNHGAQQASGDILVFLDADVKPPKDFVEKVLEVFDGTTVVGATCHIVPEHPSLSESVFFQFYNLLIRVCSNFEPHSRGEFLAVEKKSFFAVGGFDETMPCLEDHELAHRLSKLGKFVFIKNLVVYESLRRFRKLGFFKVVGTWITDYVSFVLRGKPISKVWSPVR